MTQKTLFEYRNKLCSSGHWNNLVTLFAILSFKKVVTTSTSCTDFIVCIICSFATGANIDSFISSIGGVCRIKSFFILGALIDCKKMGSWIVHDDARGRRLFEYGRNLKKRCMILGECVAFSAYSTILFVISFVSESLLITSRIKVPVIAVTK